MTQDSHLKKMTMDAHKVTTNQTMGGDSGFRIPTSLRIKMDIYPPIFLHCYDYE